MSEKNRILTELYHNAKINQVLHKLDPEELREDAKQDLFEMLAKMPEERFIKIHQGSNGKDSGLIFFSIRTLLNMMKSDRSTFANTYRRRHCEYGDWMDREDEVGEELHLTELVQNEIDSLHWYERKVLEVYSNVDCNIVAVSKETKIPYRSLFKTIRNTRSKVKAGIKAQIREREEKGF